MAHIKDVDAKQEMSVLVRQRTEALQKLSNLEKQIYNFETTYLEESSENGNIVKGFPYFKLFFKIILGFNKLMESAITGISSCAALNLVSGHSKGRRPPKRHFDEADRFFSLSSVTSPVSLSLNLNSAEGLIDESSFQNGIQQKNILTNGEKQVKNNTRSHDHQNSDIVTKSESSVDGEGGLTSISAPNKRTRRVID